MRQLALGLMQGEPDRDDRGDSLTEATIDAISPLLNGGDLN